MASARTRYRDFAPARARFYCSDCGARVFPGDQMDSRTESPLPGVSGNTVLLRTYNNRHRESPLAWCFVSGKFVETERLDPRDVINLYLRRKGVVVR